MVSQLDCNDATGDVGYGEMHKETSSSTAWYFRWRTGTEDAAVVLLLARMVAARCACLLLFLPMRSG